MRVKKLHDLISDTGITHDDCVIVGGDWNTTLETNLDEMVGTVRKGDTKTLEIESLLIDLGLLDVWWLKTPIAKRYTFRQRHPAVESRLDYFIISNCVTDIFLKRFICLVEVHYHKVNLNSDNQILHVKFSSPTR